ncbi:hypothetical protein E4T48_04793 [Aureobasidium sp. EXF-10727]|nr:hypothetical protein E4T48_04793 [Aureobasidium sp. EXF-10727]
MPTSRTELRLWLLVPQVAYLFCLRTLRLQLHQHIIKTLLPLNNIIINMHAQAPMGRGGYNRTSSLALGRGGYNRDVKASGISRPSNPSSLTVRSARATDDGRGGYN